MIYVLISNHCFTSKSYATTHSASEVNNNELTAEE